jgi:prolyl 4-hydroxylase
MFVIDTAWKQWLDTSASLGCTEESIIEAMVKGGFDKDYANTELQNALRRLAGEAGEAPEPEPGSEPIDQPYQYDAAPIASGNVIHAFDREIKVTLRIDKPQVIVFDDVLSPDECNELIERSRTKLKRSTTVNPITGKDDIIEARTSHGTWYKRSEDAFIERIEQRLASLMNWPHENGEPLQVLNYQVGAEYKAHFDYFSPDSSGHAVHIKRGGQRVATLLIYLNDVPEGGETAFPSAGISVISRQGRAVYFRYTNGQGQLDPLSFHGGAPVLSGEKWIMTQWMREGKFTG